MADEKDVRGLKIARSELSRRGFDLTRADLRMSHGVLYVKGLVGLIKGSTIKDTKTEMENMGRILKQKQDIRDVIIDCNFLQR